VSFKHHLLAIGVVASSLALTASPVLAKGGGGGGGGTPAPAPGPVAEPWALCPEYAQGGIVLSDGSSTFANQVTGVACVVARSTLSGGLFLYDMRLAPGWTASVKSAGGGNSNRIDVEFSNAATRDTHSILMAPGKTVIR
jgi:hypothetical protein